MGVEAVQLYLLLLTILNCGATCSDIVNDFQCDCPLARSIKNANFSNRKNRIYYSENFKISYN